MNIPLYQVDAFSSKVFTGNPAAVCPLKDFLPDTTMQAIAGENNLSETAFLVKRDNGYDIRWFTPASEVKLCGHATLASAHVLFNILNYPGSTINFSSKSGVLTVTRQDETLTLNFPVQMPQSCDLPAGLADGLGIEPVSWCKSDEDYLCLFQTENIINSMEPDFNSLKNISARGIIVTAPGKNHDFVSRFFAPAVGINEDPVTGSAHCVLTPFWAAKLNKTIMNAKQISPRGGEITCELKNDRVLLSGQAVLYLKGEICL